MLAQGAVSDVLATDADHVVGVGVVVVGAGVVCAGVVCAGVVGAGGDDTCCES